MHVWGDGVLEQWRENTGVVGCWSVGVMEYQNESSLLLAMLLLVISRLDRGIHIPHENRATPCCSKTSMQSMEVITLQVVEKLVFLRLFKAQGGGAF